MTPAVAVEIVSRLFLATGRKPEPGTFAVWEEALDDLQDGPALEAAMQVIRTTDMTYGPPSPVFVRDAYQAIMRRRPSDRPALVEETDPVVADPDRARAGLEEAMAQLRRNQRMPAGERRAHQPDMPGPPRLPTDAHSMGDHQFCGPDCIPIAATHAAGDHRFCAPDCPDAPTAETPEPATEPEGADV